MWDWKLAVAVLSTAVAATSLLYKFFPRKIDQLKSDLELLKLAKETGALHAPIQQRVDAQLLEIYIPDQTRYWNVWTANVFFFGFLAGGFFAVVGGLIALVARFAFHASDKTSSLIFLSSFLLGALIGVAGGTKEAEKEMKDAKAALTAERKRVANSAAKEKAAAGET